MTPHLQIVEFAVDAARCRRYAASPAGCEVVFAAPAAPAAADFAWRQVPGAGRLRRYCALAHALDGPAAARWAAVRPGWADMLFLAWLARRRGTALAFWLGEDQGFEWAVALGLRAVGSAAEAMHWQAGWAWATSSW